MTPWMNKTLLYDARILNETLRNAFEKFFDAFSIFSLSGRALRKKKVPIIHANEAFKHEVQADFTVVYIDNEKLFVIKIVDLGSNNRESPITPAIFSDVMLQLVQSVWIHRHGAPKYFISDPEIYKPFFHRFLQEHNIQLEPQAALSSHKNGKV